jgi:DNA-binding SARP family transcriptional activator/predicted ATPase/class 3 adenylate cyclase
MSEQGVDLKISVLGELKVFRGGAEITLPQSRKTKALLGFLAVVGRPQRRERLCEMFWDVPDDPRGALRWSLSKIRQIFGTVNCLQADRNAVVLDPGSFDCDFRRISSIGPNDLPKLSVMDLEAIAGVFRGSFLEDVSLPSSSEFEAWRIAHEEQTKLVRLRVLRELVERTKDAPEQALKHAHVLLSLAPDEQGLTGELKLLASAARSKVVGVVSKEPTMPQPVEVTTAPQPRLPSTSGRFRRQVSVLAAEIVTPFQARQNEDPEADLSILDPLIRTACQEVERHGGAVINANDAMVVGIFGAGLALEDHALQACRAALALKNAVAATGHDQVQLHVGLDSGEAVLVQARPGSSAQVETMGAVVRTASQLAQSLRRGAIAVTARMRDSAGGFVTAVKMAEDDFVRPLSEGPCFEVLGENRAASRWHMRRSNSLAPMIGRDNEMRALGEAGRRARARTGQAVGVVADAGVGKSRLMHEFLASDVATGCRIIESGALESSARSTFYIIKKMLRSVFEIEESDQPSDAAVKVATLVDSLGADPGMNAPLLFVLDLPVTDRDWGALSTPERVRRVRNSIMMLVSLIAKKTAVIILIEDLHWIDAESESVLSRIIDGISTQRILLMTTFRPEYRHPWASKENFFQLRLDPLDREQAEFLLRTILGADPTVRPLAQLIAERTDGVPLFIEETVQALVQSQALAGSPGAYTSPAEIRNLRVPPTIQSVIAARIDRLPKEERWLLQNAAIVGREVSLTILALVAGLDEAATAEGLNKLQDAGFLYEVQLVPSQVFVFKHALVQKVAYESIVSADRRMLHARLVETVEKQSPHFIDDYVEKLSEHAVHAELWEKAEQYLLRSATRALQRSSHNLALWFADQGLGILEKRTKTPERDRVELEYQKLKGVAWMAAKGWGANEVSAAYERAEALCEELRDESGRFTALRGRAQYYMISGQPRAAHEIASRCVGMNKDNDVGVAIETHHMFWTNNFFMGACAEAEKHADAAITLYDHEIHHPLTYKYSGHDPGVCCRAVAGLAAWQLGSLETATRRCQDALQLAQRFSHPLTTALAYWGLSYLHMFRGEPELALGWAQKEIEICDEYMLPLLHSQGVFQAGWATAKLGETDTGIIQMERGIAAIRATGAEMGLPYFLGLLAEAVAGAGERDRGLGLLEEAIGSANRNGTHFQLSELVRARAEILLHSRVHSAEEIEALFRNAIHIAEKQNAKMPALRSATAMARYLTGRRRKKDAARILAPYSSLIASIRGSHDAAAAAELS